MPYFFLLCHSEDAYLRLKSTQKSFTCQPAIPTTSPSTYKPTSKPAYDQQTMDFSSFAGQSNSIGHTTSDRSISKNYWNDLLRLFNESEYIGTSQAWSQRLYDTIKVVHTYATGPGGVIAFLRDEAVRLQGMELLDGLNRSLSLGLSGYTHCARAQLLSSLPFRGRRTQKIGDLCKLLIS